MAPLKKIPDEVLSVNFRQLLVDLNDLQPEIFKIGNAADTLARLSDDASLQTRPDDICDVIIAALAVLKNGLKVDPAIALNNRIAWLEDLIFRGEEPFFNPPKALPIPSITVNDNVPEESNRTAP